ncbi:hypothetical protein Taro_048405 [Colocasia esculenta]|uniref:Uncharacterized protein n=1 Tax=Colocasia esculenta TaxID=4460 RepID=A0A843WY95_COLES|nr:hypothetical protein [Colocasia esculenta]
MLRVERASPSSAQLPRIVTILPRQWRAVVDAVPRLGRTSRGVRRGVSNRLQHPRVPRYFLHHHLWTMAYSCKAWSRRCRLRLRRRRHYRLSCRHRLRLQLQFLRSMAMVVRPSWRGETGVPVLEGDKVRSDFEREE